jgi:hypothetical protein
MIFHNSTTERSVLRVYSANLEPQTRAPKFKSGLSGVTGLTQIAWVFFHKTGPK